MYGAQGDVADTSVVGPDVNGAGLYVGLIRGRLSNVAIVVARTDGVARECLAESMQRGTPGLTMRDAVRAAQSEIRRGAEPGVGDGDRPGGWGAVCGARAGYVELHHLRDDHRAIARAGYSVELGYVMSALAPSAHWSL